MLGPLPITAAFFLAVGFVPIGCLALALMGWVPLHLSAVFVGPPAVALAALVGLWQRNWGRRALVGLAAGILATVLYDAFRLSVVATGAINDFIPVIGQLLLRDPEAHPGWGYLWRFLGNGGCMGIAFAMLPWHSLRAGLIYGTGVCCCLFATIALSKTAEALLFSLTPLNVAIALIGHWIYGATLAAAVRRGLVPGALGHPGRLSPASELTPS